MMNLYTVEKIMKQETRERQRAANQAWMLPKRNQYLKIILRELLEVAFQKTFNFKKQTRKMYDS
ncbi:hypothetical protein ACFFF5_12105 [Lederbergia wuyishanensis]|uniref:Ribosomal protein L22 n=1 Tax=Lederbergia wuyishanensis TaxID=1347903 RepID=A0ABU0D3T2_9BACI|nr:hypothetical protein [Lederbergia wuyishanensis]MCJ8007775.1 hypothetical protein [Lederbergia wuyishanensis]MDQ0343062.1 hypothetical protein [Lederbergia wuyishanensis]